MKDATWEGIWWAPDQPSKKVAGILVFAEREGATLTLLGSLREDELSPASYNPEILVGISSSGLNITVYKCFETSRNIVITGGFPTSTVKGQMVLVGEHFDRPEAMQFSSMVVSYDQLGAWTRISGFEFSLRQDPATNGLAKYELRYSFPDSPEIRIDDFFVKFLPRFQAKPRIDSHQLIQTMFVEVRPGKVQEIGWYLEIFSHLRNFITLGVGTAVYPVQMQGVVSEGGELDGGGAQTVEIYKSVRRTTSENEVVHPAQMLFSLPRIRPHLESALKVWFSKSQVYKPIYALYFSTLYNEHLYLEGRFLTLTQAVETYHRRAIGGVYLPENQIEILLSRLGEAIDGAEMREDLRGIFKGKLQFINEVSLRNRIKELVSLIGPIGEQYIPKPGRFASLVVNTRNFLTHYNPSLAGSVATGEQLYVLTEQVRFLLEACLLRDIGLPEDLRGKLLREHQGYVDRGLHSAS